VLGERERERERKDYFCSDNPFFFTSHYSIGVGEERERKYDFFSDKPFFFISVSRFYRRIGEYFNP
jgi:hypothetical protein